MAGKGAKALVLVAVVLGLELVREWYVLSFMGFEPGRFVEWVRSDEL